MRTFGVPYLFVPTTLRVPNLAGIWRGELLLADFTFVPLQDMHISIII